MSNKPPSQDAQFVDDMLGDPSSWWKETTLLKVGDSITPLGILGELRQLLMADMKWIWANWFVESLSDPKRLMREGVNRPQVYAQVLDAVEMRFAGREAEDLRHIASNVSGIVLSMMKGLEKTQSGRRRWSKNEKEELLDRAGLHPRCWICGSEFSKLALQQFLTGNRDTPIPPLDYVDILRPRGIRGEDLAIHVDHVLAFAQGGGEVDNLALACGWCNMKKSSNRWLYDVNSQPFPGKLGKFKGVNLPQPFWTVRLMGVIRKCQHTGGCDLSADNSEITVAPMVETAVFNPLNLQVTCLEHDTYSARYQTRKEAVKAWGLTLS